MTTVMESSRIVAVPHGEAMDRFIPIPLPDIFARRHLALPPIKRVDGQDGRFDEVGQSRTIRLADGGSMVETLTVVGPPTEYGYRIDQVRGPLKPLAKEIRGLWTFTPAGDSTTITWRWEVEPAPLGRPLMPLFARMWRGYADKALERLAELI
jgi:hypothetical protein